MVNPCLIRARGPDLSPDGEYGELAIFAYAPTQAGGGAVKKFFAQLRPLERRLAVAVLVALFLVLNYIFVWPHFSDWGR